MVGFYVLRFKYDVILGQSYELVPADYCVITDLLPIEKNRNQPPRTKNR